MHHFQRLLPAADDAFQVHQAAHISTGDHFRLVLNVIGYTIYAHLHGYGFLCHAEGAAEAAAFIGTVERYQFQPFHHLQQLLRLGEGCGYQLAHLRQVQATLAVAALVQPHAVREAAGQGSDLQYVCQELGEFVYPFPYLSRGSLLCRIMKMFFDMQHTAAGRSYDVIVSAEIFYEQVITIICEVLKAGVGHGLAAAGLALRVVDLAAQFLQQLQRGYTYLRVELVDIARNK